MRNLRPYKRSHHFKPYRGGQRGRGGGSRYPLFVGGCALLVVLAVLSSKWKPAGQTETAATEVYYPNCASARAAGVAPIHVGEPGYRPELDADGDGIACEPYRGY